MLIDDKYLELALRALHKSFGLEVVAAALATLFYRWFQEEPVLA